MNISDFKIEEFLDFRPQEGNLFLKDARSLIVNTDAFGTLRNDLIHNLGFDRAKGFLLRYGWQIGFIDGESVLRDFDFENEQEYLAFGSVLFASEGFGRAENDFIQIDRQTKTFNKKGRWINSFEADQHIRFFGEADEPVCWLLIGYAGGYGSAILGETVYFVETKCMGKGDPVCEWEGRTLAEWGGSDFSELHFYELQTISEELETAYKRIQEQNKQLEKSLDTHEELYQLVLHAGDLSTITNTISELFDGVILLYNNRMRLLTATHGIDCELTKAINRKLERNLKTQLFCYSNREVNLLNQIQRINVKVKDNEIEYHYLVFPIITGEETLGFILALNQDRTSIHQESVILLQRSADIYTMELMRQRELLTLEHQFRADFIETLFSQKYTSEDTLIAWGERLGFNVLEPHYVLALEIEQHSELDGFEKKLKQRKDSLDELTQLLKKRFASFMYAETNENIVILIPANKPRDFVEKTVLNSIREISLPESHIMVGIGSITTGIDSYYQSYTEAGKAQKVIRLFHKKYPILFYDDLGSMSVLLDVQDSETLLKFMNTKLKSLLDYDEKNNADLLTTMEHYLSCENIYKASQVTNLSLSGFKYRLNKIKELCCDLNSPDALFDFQLAIKIYRLSQ
ncbi:XylR N-terminal domain-containing protein [Acetobacterium malicum]|uniref:XylR N-terminal domain-containing protein n=1 Tax=Acetobacterium malicum TaxID=52692 RepID=UPI0004027888|nr:XylR N-terminal domain-containing protein [Acetobacterium dehalogenans]